MPNRLMGLRFLYPYGAVLVAQLPVIGVLFWRRQTRQRYTISSLAAIGSPDDRPGSLRARVHGLDMVIWLLGAALSILALMRPQWGVEYTQRTQEGVAIMLAIDTSRSMAALHF